MFIDQALTHDTNNHSVILSLIYCNISACDEDSTGMYVCIGAVCHKAY